MLMREAFKMTKEMHERINKVDDLMAAFKDKIEHSASYLLLIGEGVKKLVEMAKNHTKKSTKKK